MNLKTKKINEMLGTITLVLLVVFFGTFIAMMILTPSAFNKKNSFSSVQDGGFTIEKYKVFLDVQENNQIKVTEDITVDWYNTNHHGIYKFIPEWLNYTDKNNNTIKRKSKITNLESSTDSYEIDKVSGKKRIKLGSSYSYVTKGLKTYSISYIYNMGKDPYKGFDEFIFHSIGDYWNTTIKNFSLEVKIPKNFDSTKINFFLDKYRQKNINDLVNYSVKDNIIYATTNLDLTNSFTIDIELPDNYFQHCSSSYGFISLILIIGILILTYYTFRKWQKYGKDYPMHAKTIEFYPPDDLNAAQVGYIYGTTSNSKLTIALIVELASKGYIKINEKDKDIEVVNLYPLPRLKVVEQPIHTLKIRRLKDIDKTLSKEASIMMKHLFKQIPFVKNDVVEITDSINSFLKVQDELVTKGFVEIVNDNNSSLEKQKKIQEAEEKKFEMSLKEHQKKISNLKPLSEMEQIVYDRLFETADNILISEHQTLYKAFSEVGSLLSKDQRIAINDYHSLLKLLSSCLVCILELLLLYFSYSIIKDLDPKFSFLYQLGLMSTFISIFFTIIMERKTEYRSIVEPQIDGFREFLEKAEKDELEALVTKNPSYFYDILPYTYVLGISKKWISKFENIYMPKIDMGTFDYGSDAAYLNMASDFYYPPSSSSGSSSSGGCSSCGGGCSSCGGGCSSCGGGGSW